MGTSERSPLSRLQALLLILILLSAAALRLYNPVWDQGTLPHPDERSTVAFYAPSIRFPEQLSDALNPRLSPLNPFWDTKTQHRRSYTYGHFPLYTLVLTAAGVEKLAPLATKLGIPEDSVQFMADASSVNGYACLGRILMALFDTLTVYVVFLLGRRLYSNWAGLLAAAFSAFTVLQIQLAHFFAVDSVSAVFTFLALYGSILMVGRRNVWAAILAGAAIGLAVSSKYSALPIAAAPIVATYFSTQRSRKAEAPTASEMSPLTNLILTGLVCLVVFALTSPFVFLDFQNFWQAVVKEQGDMVSGVADMPFTRQYRGTAPYLYFLKQQILWGMGIPLGLLSMAGLIWVLIRAVKRQLGAGEWIVLSWLVLYFGPTGLFLAKFMRYMIPVVPLLVVFGAGLVTNIRWQIGRIDLKYLRYGVAGVVLAGTIVWAAAFVNGVYTSEHSWVTASRWVYENVPNGACIVGEHWEEGFPRSWDEPGMRPEAHAYFQPQLPMYEEDTRQKFEIIRDTLKQCDYVVLASNRLWRTIPRLPDRYPMSSRYYQALFDGQLGFEEVYRWSTPPRLGPVVIEDQSADESFTVYDHPQPIIFKKVRQLSDDEWERLLGNAWIQARPGHVGPPTLLTRLRGRGAGGQFFSASFGQTTGNEKQKSLLLDQAVDNLPVVNDFGWNTLANRSTLFAIFVWWLAIQILGLLTWPLARRLFDKMADQGYLLSKSLGWLLVGFVVWLLSSLKLLPNALPTIAASLLVLAVIGGMITWRDRNILLAAIRERARLIVLGEVFFGLAFLFFVGLRIVNPDLWQPWNGGEKMLEIGFLNAILKSAHMPPYDPYFAGGYINYYYYGLFLVGILVKLTGIQATIAFNLAVASLAALTVGNVFCLGYSLYAGTGARSRWQHWQDIAWRPLAVGLVAVLLVVFIGNLAGFEQLIHLLEDHGGSSFNTGIPIVGEAVRATAGLRRVLVEGVKLPAYNYWDPTRAIPDTINEFPYFSFIFADLHPHMIGLPFTVLFLAMCYSLFVRTRKSAVGGPAVSTPTAGKCSQAGLLVSSCEAEPGAPAIGMPEEGRNHLTRQIVWDVLAFLRNLSWGEILRWLALPFCLGALAVINTWDLPSYLGIVVLTYWLSRYRQSRGVTRGFYRTCIASPSTVRRIVINAGEALLFGLFTLAASYVFYWPFFAHYQPMDVGFGLVRDKTDPGQFLSIWGLFLFIAVSYLIFSLIHPQTRMGVLRNISLFVRRWNVAPHLFRLHKRLVTSAGRSQMAGLWGAAGVVIVSVILWTLGYKVPALLLPQVCLSFLLLLRLEPAEGQSFAGILLFTGLLLLLGVEVFFLRDFLGGSSYYRMNTLFKFYIQVWVMLGIAAAFFLVDLWNRAANWRKTYLPMIWQAAIVVLLFASLTYPILGTPTRLRDRFPQPTPIGSLDGMSYMTTGILVWPQDNPIVLKYDYQAIRWLQEHVLGTPVLAEAKIGYYREGGMRVASYTGLPTPLGGLHQSEQRWPMQLSERDAPYMEFWNTSDPERAWQLIDKLDISYIYLGQLERTLYDPNLTEALMTWGVTHFNPTGFQKFQALENQGRLEPVYQNDGTRILRVIK